MNNKINDPIALTKYDLDKLQTAVNAEVDFDLTTDAGRDRFAGSLVEKIKAGQLKPNQASAAKRFLDDYMDNKARTSFYHFVLRVAPTVLPGDFINGRHIEVLANAFQDVVESVEDPRRLTERMQVFLAPGAMKSTLINVMGAAWCMGTRPHWNILVIAATTKLAEDKFGRPTKDLVTSDVFKRIFPEVHVRKDSRAVGRFGNDLGGEYYCTGAMGALVGRRGHIIICDDVLTEGTANSKTERTKINNWYVSGVRSRLFRKPFGAEVIVNTRWRMDDLSGFLQEKDRDSRRPWKIYCIPAILDELGSKLLRKPTDPEGLYAPGTSFWPEMQPLDMLLEMKSGHTASEWSALFQQNPIPDKGVIIGKGDFRYWQYEDPPVCKFILCSMDTAFTQGKDSDPSAYQVWGVFDQPGTTASGKEIYVENLILLEGDAQKLTFPALCEKVKEIYQVHQPDAFVVEDRGSGISLIQELRMQGYPVHAFKSDKDKQTRLYACTPYFEAKRIWIPKNKYWAEELVEESSQFPYGAHDDRVDAMSSAILFLRDMGMLDPTRNVSAIGWADDDMDEDEKQYRKSMKSKTYWGAIVDRIRA